MPIEPVKDIIGFLREGDYNSEFVIPATYGHGTIKKTIISKGLYLHTWDCVFYEQLIFPASTINYPGRPDFSLVFYLSANAVSLQNDPVYHLKIGEIWNTLFICGPTLSGFVVSPNEELKFIYIGFTNGWLGSESGEIVDFEKLNKREGTKFSIPDFFFETAGSFEKKMIEDLYSLSVYEEKNPLFLKSRVVTLINDFISKIGERDFSTLPSYTHSFEITKIEARLLAEVTKGLPSLKDLAREFCLSESTLKREFKKVYGASISEYFMQKKMNYAHKLLTEKNGNVSEVAWMLGYEKVSRFIVMFKKYKGISPGTLLRETIK